MVVEPRGQPESAVRLETERKKKADACGLALNEWSLRGRWRRLPSCLHFSRRQVILRSNKTATLRGE